MRAAMSTRQYVARQRLGAVHGQAADGITRQCVLCVHSTVLAPCMFVCTLTRVRTSDSLSLSLCVCVCCVCVKLTQCQRWRVAP